MAQTIKLRRSATASAVPTTGQLALGELAINTFDGKLFLKKDNGTQSIVEIGAGGAGASVTVSTTAPSSPTAGDLWWDSTNGVLKIYYDDGSSSQWVDASVGAAGPAGADGPSNITTSTATTISGLLKGASSLVAAATAGTDYVAPGGALGTPSSGTLTNATGLPIDGGTTGTLPVTRGGTGLTTLTGGYIPFGNGTSALGSSANLAWSDTYKQLSVGGSSWVSAMMSVGGTTPTTSNFSEAFVVAPTLHAACTSGSHIMSWLYTEPATALTSHTHYMARQGTLGAGTTITDQYGYIASSTLTSATNNYGFYSAIASGTGRWNFYAVGTAANYFAGQVGIGVTPSSTIQLQIGGNAVGGTTSGYGTYLSQTAPSTMTASYTAYYSIPNTLATMGSLTHFGASQGIFFGGASVTNQYGFHVDATLTGATNNYGFYSNIPAATGDWNFYASGTARNYFAGDTGVGIAPDGTQFLHIGAGTATKAPIELNAGTNMTTVDPGSIEYDGTCLYFTPFGTSRGVVPGEQMVVLGATNTLTSQTGAQPLFDNASANGRVDLAIGTYWFECSFSLTSMSNTSGSLGFALAAGTAVISAQGWRAWAVKAALATATNAQMSYNTAANTTLATAATGTTGHALISGFVRITTAGTVVPQVSLGVASAAVVGVNSYFRIFPVSPTGTAATNLVIGNWS